MVEESLRLILSEQETRDFHFQYSFLTCRLIRQKKFLITDGLRLRDEVQTVDDLRLLTVNQNQQHEGDERRHHHEVHEGLLTLGPIHTYNKQF